MLAGLESPPEVMFLQEVGEVRGVPLASHKEDFVEIAGKDFVAYVANPEFSHRCSVLLVACELEFKLHAVHVHGIGLSIRGDMLGRSVMLAGMHFPHAHRPDALEVWRSNLASLQDVLDACPSDSTVVVGHDLNQDVHAEVDAFEGMLHYRQLLLRTGLEVSPPQGATWVARGSESCIDFFLFRTPQSEVSFWLREDYRISLPSDHNAIGMRIQLAAGRTPLRRRPRQTRCSKWLVDQESLWKQLRSEPVWNQETIEAAVRTPGVSTRPPSLRYVDPPDIKELIELRKQTRERDARAALMQEIHQRRRECCQRHKEQLLSKAKAGDRRAIAHMRASASGSFTEGSYLYRAGGLTKAVQDLHDFYERKYSTEDPPISSEHWRLAMKQHSGAQLRPITREDLQKALAKCKIGVSSGLDGVTFEGLKAVVQRDACDRLPQYFTSLLKGDLPIPGSWLQGKIVLLPKVPRPCRPADLRPICLVPVLSRLFAKVVMMRLRDFAPEYAAHQLACRPGVQVLDGITAAQSTMALIKRLTGRTAKVAKLDIRAAFDSVSHQAVFQWIMACSPSLEALSIMKLCFGTSVRVGLGGMDKTLEMHRGIMQGSAFSADVFSRLMDWYLAPLLSQFDTLCPEWESQLQGLPHFLIYADDLIIFADSESTLQAKVRAVVQTLRTIGLSVNHEKCRVLNDSSGTTPGVWLRQAAKPLAGEDHLLFLGVPLGHSTGPQLIMTHLLRKASNTFFAIKRLLDDSSTPLTLRLQLFESYVTSKWQWAAPCMYPDFKTLKSIEGHKNTYLMSLCRVGTDALLPWLENTVSRRRAVRLMCASVRGPDWRRMWLRRFWTYHGHLARCSIQHPMRRLVSTCTVTNLRRGLKASWVMDLHIRKLQKVYTRIAPEAVRIDYPAWETCARNRKQWAGLMSAWENLWLPPMKEPQPTLEYLCDRQLVLVQRRKCTEQMYLRPSRDILQEPYTRGLWWIRELYKPAPPFIWLHQDQGAGGCYAVLMLEGRDTARSITVQVRPPQSGPLAMALASLTVGCKLAKLLRLLGRRGVRVAAPLAVLRREIFQEAVPLHLLPDLSEALRALEGSAEVLHLQPKTTPPQVQVRLGCLRPHAMPTKYLVRSDDFTEAYFGEDFARVYAAIQAMLKLKEQPEHLTR